MSSDTGLHATVRSPALIKLDEEIKQNVLRGIEFLKHTYGDDWVEHIDLKKLDLKAGEACVLGQVHPAYYPFDDSYGDGYNQATDTFLDGGEGREYGFTVPDVYNHYVDGVDAWEVLQKEWERQIPNEKVRYERKQMMGKE